MLVNSDRHLTIEYEKRKEERVKAFTRFQPSTLTACGATHDEDSVWPLTVGSFITQPLYESQSWRLLSFAFCLLPFFSAYHINIHSHFPNLFLKDK